MGPAHKPSGDDDLAGNRIPDISPAQAGFPRRGNVSENPPGGRLHTLGGGQPVMIAPCAPNGRRAVLGCPCLPRRARPSRSSYCAGLAGGEVDIDIHPQACRHAGAAYQSNPQGFLDARARIAVVWSNPSRSKTAGSGSLCSSSPDGSVRRPTAWRVSENQAHRKVRNPFVISPGRDAFPIGTHCGPLFRGEASWRTVLQNHRIR